MHNRPRVPLDAPRDEAKERKAAERTAALGKLVHVVLEARAQRRHDAESLARGAVLVEQVPELYTAWNYRREATQAALQGAQGPEEAKALGERELALTERALRRNPKSYSAWHQRKWLVGLLRPQGALDMAAEFRLIRKLLDLDERNFHGWGYYRFLCAQAGAAPEEVLDHTTARIEANFSNYSAWHARTTALPLAAAAAPVLSLAQLVQGGAPAPPAPGEGAPLAAHTLRQEFALVKSAFFTDPEDQSAWLYHRWLLAQTLRAARRADGPGRQELLGLVAEELVMCEELLAAEPDRGKCKWPLLTKANLLQLRGALHEEPSAPSASSAQADCAGPGEAAGDSVGGAPGGGRSAQGGEQGASGGQAETGRTRREPPEEVRAIYRELMAIDPKRRGFYRDAMEGRADIVAS